MRKSVRLRRFSRLARPGCWWGVLLPLLISCRSVESQPVVQPVATGTLRAAFPFPIGAAMNPTLLTTNAAYGKLGSTEFSSLTAENYLKMATVHPAQDRYDWTNSDVLVTFAEQNKQRMHGHTLIWHQSVPGWVTAFRGDSVAWEALFKNHIQTVVSHYKGRITAWDVVNEAFSDDGTLRPGIWLTHLGPDYVARAFRYAREAAPDFKRRGIPVDGLGLQMHTNISQSNAGIENALQNAAATGLLVHISELDVRVNPDKKADYMLTDADAQKQRQTFAAIVRAYRTLVPVAQQYGITTWNIGDADSWIPGNCGCIDFPLPFNKQYARKPAYDGLLDGLQ